MDGPVDAGQGCWNGCGRGHSLVSQGSSGRWEVVRRRRIGPWYRLAAIVLRPLVLGLTTKNWRGAENLPAQGGFVVVANHVSYADFLTFAHFIYDNGHLPRFLTKEAIFRVPVIGRVVSGAEQIPVFRETADAADSYAAAVDAVRRGECVAIYPEGTLTRDPDLWPMRGKTGAARIALATGCPVVPIAQWGAQQILPPYRRWPKLLPRHESYVWAGRPVDLSRFSGLPLSAQVLAEATDQIMADVTALLAEIRQQPAPPQRWDPRASGQPLTGNPGDPGRSRPTEPTQPTEPTDPTQPDRSARRPEDQA
jgi:1-acyl-sn-glycerol-3-phosphate acyltransferase